jgi:UDP-3-O-[3-hydroxymyristoyl] glucosamine N-acyltransferase LpxD
MLHARLEEQEIRRIVGIPGDGDLVVEGIAPLAEGSDRCLYFANRKLSSLGRTALAALQDCIVIAPIQSRLANALDRCRVLEVANPRAAVANVLGFIETHQRQAVWVASGAISPAAIISPLALVDPRAEVGPGVVIEPFCTVGPDVRIGARSVIRAGARLFQRVIIGEASTIGANTVIGHPGYGFVRDSAGHKSRIPHLGGVLIGSHVDIGALVVVQSGTLDPTVIEDHAKIDDNVEVAHNARVESGASVTGGVVIGGSAVIGRDAWIGINASVRDGRRVGAHSLVGMSASVQHNLPDASVARAPRTGFERRPPDDDVTKIGFARRSKRRS